MNASLETEPVRKGRPPPKADSQPTPLSPDLLQRMDA